MSAKCLSSLPFSLPLAIPAKTNQECEPLSEPKVTPACLCLRRRAWGRGQLQEHGHLHPGDLPSSPGASRPRRKTGHPGAWTRCGGSGMWAGAAGAWRSTRNACELTRVLDLVWYPPRPGVHANGLEAMSRAEAAPDLAVSEPRAGMLELGGSCPGSPASSLSSLMG